MSETLADRIKLRWDRGGDLGEHGTVTAKVQDDQLCRTDLYELAAVDRRRKTVRYTRSERARERGSAPDEMDHGGPLAGLVLRYVDHERLVYSRSVETPRQDLPQDVAEALLEAGAAEVGA